MSKLATQDKFLDLSDYGRFFGKFLAKRLVNTRFTPIHVTFLFGISGLIAIAFILYENYFWAGFFLVLKSGIDAADGELARLTKKPSYVGRYLDSVFDFVLNFFIFMAICFVADTSFWLAITAFFCIQLQGTLYNFYYVILRNKSVGADATSKIFEYKSPKALPGELQQSVNILFAIYTLFYGIFDRIIYFLDKNAHKVKTFPNWFMTLVSVYGLGFQLLLIAILLCFGCLHSIIPFFIFYTVLIFILIAIRKTIIT